MIITTLGEISEKQDILAGSVHHFTNYLLIKYHSMDKSGEDHFNQVTKLNTIYNINLHHMPYSMMN